jgi:Zn-dependent protease with chaperone function
VAHGLAQHHGERQSVQIGPNILLYGLIFLTAPLPGAFLAMQALGGWLVDMLFGQPMSRKMESEADYIGLMLMAEACYDPREAAAFWGRMEARAARAGADEVPEWMSTHPSVSHLSLS